MDPNGRKVARFGVFELDLTAHELRKQGLKIRLSEQPIQILLLLLERAGDTVTREELRQRLWSQDTFVDFDAGLNSAIKKLRDALGDPAENPRFIETLPRRGYRFIGQIGRAPVEPSALQPPAQLPPDDPQPVARRSAEMWTVAVPLTALTTVAAWLIIVGFSGRWSDGNGSGVSARPVGSVAVLPCQNLANDLDQQHFVDDMTEAITWILAQFKSLKSPSRTAVIEYTPLGKSRAQIVRELDVKPLIECAVMRSKDRVRVTSTPSTGRELWEQTYDGEVRYLLSLQIELADQIAGAIHIEIRPEARSRLARSPAGIPAAHGRVPPGPLLPESPGQPKPSAREREDFDKAIALDPTYASAHSDLSKPVEYLSLVPLMVRARKTHPWSYTLDE